MLPRPALLHTIEKKCRQFPVVVLLGPRQCGKTTLAKTYTAQLQAQNQPCFHFDLEDPDDLNALENAKLVFERLDGLIILDEIQRRPDLFPLLRVMVDQSHKRFLILGSASRELLQQSSETLAGRVDYIEITPFRLTEWPKSDHLWLRGGFPPACLAASDSESYDWTKAYIRSFLERDIPNLGFDISSGLMRRFWNMLCVYHGQLFHAADIGNALDINHKTINKYLDILVGTFMIRTLSPWFANIKKRQVKRQKIYIRDSGILHHLLGLMDMRSLLVHPKLGASWEGFALEEVISVLGAEPQDCFFWASHTGAEIDLLIHTPSTLKAFEFKFSSSPKMTRGITAAIDSLGLTHVDIIVPSAVHYPLSDKVSVIGLTEFVQSAPN